MAQPGVVAPWRATYVPGEWYVVAGPTSLVVLEPGPGRSDMVADLWVDVVASASMSDLVDRLAGYGITELPELAVIFWSAAGMRTLVRGGIRFEDPSSGAPIATGDGVVTWNEVGLEAVTQVRVQPRDQPSEGDPLPLAVGVVRAGAVALRATEDDVIRSPQPLLRSARRHRAEPAGAASRGIAAGSADLRGSADDGSAASSEVVASDIGMSAQVPGAASDEPAEPADSRSGVAQADGREVHADDDTGPDFPPLEDDDSSATGESSFDGLTSPWGPQSASTPDQPAVIGTVSPGGLAAAAAVAAPGGPVPAPVGSPAPRVPVPEPAEQYEMEHGDTQLMAGAVPEGPSGGPGVTGAGNGAPFAGTSAPTEPLVEAIRCPNGHANAPGSTSCRVCRAPLGGRAPEMMPQPLLARLRAADGTVVDLDRAVLLGRAPSEQRSTAPLPRLVTLASPAQDISRTHLQVVPENWQVMVTDLKSTNGTFVTDPAGNSGLLPPEHATPVPIGSVLELGEGVTITIEPGD